MDVRCERCRAQYVFDDEQVTPSGLTVQCTNCGHVFKVKKKELVVTVPVKPGEEDGEPLPATSAAPRAGGHAATPAPSQEPERPREWRVRQGNGNVFTFRELTTLQKWIVEQKVSRDDEISLSGDQWKRLGNIAELASFFQVVEAAERAKTTGGAPAVTPLPLPAMPVYGVAIQAPGLYPPPPSGYPPPSFTMPASVPGPAAEPPPPRAPSIDVDLGPDEVAAVHRGRGRTVVLVAFLAVAVGAAAYVLTPRLLARKPPPEESLAVPITIEMGPSGAEEPASPPAAQPPSVATPVPAPEPLVEPSVRPPPEPAAKAVDGAPPAPKSPKALVAQANKLREKGNVEGALDVYGRVVDYDPENAEALTGRGLCYLDLSRYGPAEASFQAALAANPDQPDALLGLAETYRWQGKKADAITNYEKYLARHPDGEEADVARNALEELRK
jgi:predicted Zn finger-like uncharacterized protein